MGRNALIFLRLLMIAGAIALLVLYGRAASAQSVLPAGPALPQQAQSYGSVPIQDVVPDSQPYGIKPIPGYIPPAQTPAAPPPEQLRGSFEEAPPLPARQQQNPYGYVPLRQAAPAPSAQQPQLRMSTATYDDSDAVYASQASRDLQAVYQDSYTANRADAGYQLGPGDKIRVTVFGESDLSGEYQVDGSGMVQLPLIGTLHAAGATAPGLEQGIADALTRGYLKNPRVNVEISTYRPFYIIGAINRPGQYAYIDHMSALNAVALAGGFTDQAIQSTIYIRHEGSAVEQPVEIGEITHIRPGDVIRVKTSLFWEAMNLFSPVAEPAALTAAALH
jgi:protein involved in polysaccharide export with SLBB domain